LDASRLCGELGRDFKASNIECTSEDNFMSCYELLEVKEGFIRIYSFDFSCGCVGNKSETSISPMNKLSWCPVSQMRISHALASGLRSNFSGEVEKRVAARLANALFAHASMMVT
jgi:hypothetical protein